MVINLKYENFNPKIHDTRKVATYVYDVDFRTFDLLFKNKDKAISTIEHDLKKHNVDNNFNCYCNEYDNNVGMNFQFMFSSFMDRKLTTFSQFIFLFFNVI